MGSFMRARKIESTESDDAHTLHTVSVHINGYNRPDPREAKGVCGFKAGAGSSELEVQGDMNQRVTPNPPLSPKKTNKKTQWLSYDLAFSSLPYLGRACIHQPKLNSSMTPLVPGSEFGSTLLSSFHGFPFSPLFFPHYA